MTTAAYSRSRGCLWAAAIAVVGAIVADYVFQVLLVDVFARRPERQVAIYERMSFDIIDDKYCVFRSGGVGEQLATIWLKIRGQEAVFLPIITEEHLASVAELDRSLSFDEKVTQYAYSHCRFTTREGNLEWVRLEYTGDLFRIGPRKDGPFLAMPIALEDAQAAFGRPLSYEKIREPSR